jgi:hypothetical protein
LLVNVLAPDACHGHLKTRLPASGHTRRVSSAVIVGVITIGLLEVRNLRCGEAIFRP